MTILSRFYLTPERHGQTDRQTKLLCQYRASVCSHSMKTRIVTLFPRSFVTQPSPSTSLDNPWKLIFSTTILIDSVSLLLCTFIGFLQFRHRTRFRDSFCLASVFKCLFTYLVTASTLAETSKTRTWHTQRTERDRRIDRAEAALCIASRYNKVSVQSLNFIV